MIEGKRLGYIRVSTVDQNPDRQLIDIQLDKKFIEYASAKSIERPQLKLLLEFIREKDIVFVHSMDRLARNLMDLRGLVKTIIDKGAEIRFIKENISFNGQESSMSTLMLSLMGAFAEFELAFLRERQAEGIRIAKAKGLYKGTVKKLTKAKQEELKQYLKTRKSKTEIAFIFGISRETLYRYIRDLGLSGDYINAGDEDRWIRARKEA